VDRNLGASTSMGASIRAADSGLPVFRIVGRPTPTGPTWVWAQDDLDLATVSAARTQLAGLFAGDAAPRCVLVYLGADCFVDLRGLRLLVDTATQTRCRGGHLAVVAPPYCVQWMADRFDLGDELPLVPTAQHAAWWARARRP
jgi:anti-anti-sigma factor